MIDLTEALRAHVNELPVNRGLLLITVPHTTCGLTVNEHADPDVASDLLKALDRMVPWEQGFSHGEGNAAAHMKASLLGCSVTLALSDHEVVLGRWQGLFLCEFDGPRTRTVRVELHASGGENLG